MDATNRKEGTVRGTVEMLLPLVFRTAQDAEFFAHEPKVAISSPSFAQLLVFEYVPGGRKDIGMLELQQLPDDRVLLGFMFRTKALAGNAYTDDRRDAFERFIAILVQRLQHLGFIDLPATPTPPKPPMGFLRTPPTDSES